MLKRSILAGLGRAEKRLGLPGSMDYMREVVRGSTPLFLKFSLFLPLAAHRRRLPRDAYHAARITASRHQDCGTCVEVEVAEGLLGGVGAGLLQAVADGRVEALDEVPALAARFARAVCEQDADLDELREKVRARWGAEGVAELAFAVASAQLFPVAKRALGHARSCSAAPLRVEAMAASGRAGRSGA